MPMRYHIRGRTLFVDIEICPGRLVAPGACTIWHVLSLSNQSNTFHFSFSLYELILTKRTNIVKQKVARFGTKTLNQREYTISFLWSILYFVFTLNIFCSQFLVCLFGSHSIAPTFSLRRLHCNLNIYNYLKLYKQLVCCSPNTCVYAEINFYSYPLLKRFAPSLLVGINNYFLRCSGFVPNRAIFCFIIFVRFGKYIYKGQKKPISKP